MLSQNLKNAFSSITSFEEFEKLKLQTELLKTAAKEILHKHGLPDAELKLFSEGTNIVFLYDEHLVIKIFPPFHYDQYKSEDLVLRHVSGNLSVKTPQAKYDGELLGWPYIVMTKLEGTLLETLWQTMDHENKMVIMGGLGALIREVHALPTVGLETIDSHWEQFIERQILQCVEQQQATGLPSQLVEELPAYLDAVKDSLIKVKKPVLLTGEYTPMNFLVKQVSGMWHITGLIDFGDAMLGLPEYDLLGPGAFLIQGDKQLLKALLDSYGYSLESMTPVLSHSMTALMLLHKYSNLEIQLRIKDWKKDAHSLKDLENLVWGCELSNSVMLPGVMK